MQTLTSAIPVQRFNQYQLASQLGAGHLTASFPLMYLISPAKFCIAFVFHFSWVLPLSQEKLKTMLMHNNFEWQIRYVMGNVEVA